MTYFGFFYKNSLFKLWTEKQSCFHKYSNFCILIVNKIVYCRNDNLTQKNNNYFDGCWFVVYCGQDVASVTDGIKNWTKKEGNSIKICASNANVMKIKLTLWYDVSICRKYLNRCVIITKCNIFQCIWIEVNTYAQLFDEITNGWIFSVAYTIFKIFVTKWLQMINFDLFTISFDPSDRNAT